MERYHQVHGHDISSFDLSSTHRLPTVSAAQALADLDGDPSQRVSIGLPDLDAALAPGPQLSDASERELPLELGGPGGLLRGQTYEIWGPPGSGKTAVGIQLAANALVQGQVVVWVDCFYTVCIQRLESVTESVTRSRLTTDGQDGSTAGETSRRHLQRFTHYSCPTLAHLVALLCRPAADNLPPGTTVVIVDGLTALLNHTLPRVPDAKNTGNSGISISGRRHQTLQYLSSALQKLAATRNCAVVVLSQCATRMQFEAAATLIPAVNATSWERGFSSRLVLFRDWAWTDGQAEDLCFAGVQKLDGKATQETIGCLVAFRVAKEGLESVRYEANQPPAALSSSMMGAKRKYGDAGLDDGTFEEDYGWQEEDGANLPGMPPQWQGSEDLLVGQRRYDDYGREDNDDDEDDDEGGRSLANGNADEGHDDDLTDPEAAQATEHVDPDTGMDE